MQRYKTVRVLKTYCDICGEECGNGTLHMPANGTVYHACSAFDEASQSTHHSLLMQRIRNEDFPNAARPHQGSETQETPPFLKRMLSEGRALEIFGANLGYKNGEPLHAQDEIIGHPNQAIFILNRTQKCLQLTPQAAHELATTLITSDRPQWLGERGVLSGHPDTLWLTINAAAILEAENARLLSGLQELMQSWWSENINSICFALINREGKTAC